MGIPPVPVHSQPIATPTGQPDQRWYEWLSSLANYIKVGAVDIARRVIAGTGLSGGGPLSGDVTLSVVYGTTAGTAAQGNDSRIVGAFQTANAAALTKTNDTNVTITLAGSPTTALVNPASIAVGWAGTLAVARGGTGGGTASGTLLDNISGFASTGFLVRTAAGTYAFRGISAGSGISVTNPDGVSASPAVSLADTAVSPASYGSASAVASFTVDQKGRLTAASNTTILPDSVDGISASGLIARTAANTRAARTITGTSAEITITNGDGVSGNPTASLPSALTFTGKTVTGGTFTSMTALGVGGATNASYKAVVVGGNANQMALDNDGSQYTELDYCNSGSVKALTFWDNTAAAFVFRTLGTTNKIRYDTNATPRAYIDGNGNVAVGSSLATTATNGFLYIPTCAGAPTGTPTSISGLVPMVYDTTNNRFYFYNSGWKTTVAFS